MKTKTRNKLIVFGIIIGCVIIIILIACRLSKRLPIIEENGRKAILVFPGSITIQAPPPRTRLISYMNRKYGIIFHEYKGEEYKETGFSWSHIPSERFDRSFNGILVYTEDYPGHYFFVCDQYGTIHDDYGCHLVEKEAEQVLYEKLDDVIEEDFKIIVHPNSYQETVFSKAPTCSEYLDNGDYIIRVYICSDGSRAEEDESLFLEHLSPYWGEYTFLDVFYVDEDTFSGIDPDNFSSFCGDIPYNVHAQGCGMNKEGKRNDDWRWICN